MVSGPLVGDEASNRFYSRSTQNPNHVLRHSSSERQSLMQGEATSFDSSNDGANGPRGYSRVGDKVRICLNSKADIEGIKWKLKDELEQVRRLMRDIEAKEAQFTAGYGISHLSDNDYVDHDINDDNVRATTPFRGLNVAAVENDENDNRVVEKKRKIPKGNDVKLAGGGKKLLSASGGKKGEVGLLLGPDKHASRLLKNCVTLLEKLMKHKHGWVFNKPVDARGLGLLDYYKIVKRPMDLGTVKTRLDKNWYKTAAEFAEDVRLTFHNAMLYNPKEQDVHVMAALLLNLFEEKWKVIEDQFNLRRRNETGNDEDQNRRAEMGNDSELPTPVSKNAQAHARPNINRRVEMGSDLELPTPVSRNALVPARHNINRRVEMNNDSELPIPVSRNAQAPAQHNNNRRVEMDNDSDLPTPVSKNAQAPVRHNINRRVEMGNNSESPTAVSRNVQAPPRPPPFEMRTLERAESITKPVDPKSKPASIGHPGRKSVAKKPKARDPDKRDMTMQEKQKLSADLQALPSEKLANVVQIVKKRSQGILQQDDEIELDIGSVDPETLWELDRFVTNYKKSLTKNKRKSELASQSVTEPDYDIQENEALGTTEAQYEAREVEYNDNAHSPLQREEGGEHLSGSSSSSSESGSSSTDSDNDSSSGSGSYSNRSPRT